MTKTKDTIDLENALDERCAKRREYGCKEVTIGFLKDKLGNEIVDYMTMDSDHVFRCYELKVSVSDLKSDAKKSWYGDYNYLVISKGLYAKNPVFENYIPPYAGILVGTELTTVKRAKKKNISVNDREMLKDSLIRSVFWKMNNFKDADKLENYRTLEKKLSETEQEFADFRIKVDREHWTYHDYETWYRKNHQNPDFTIEKQAQKERAEYISRKENVYCWKEKDGKLICPNCQKAAPQNIMTDYCPFCGSDLRKLRNES